MALHCGGGAVWLEHGLCSRGARSVGNVRGMLLFGLPAGKWHEETEAELTHVCSFFYAASFFCNNCHQQLLFITVISSEVILHHCQWKQDFIQREGGERGEISPPPPIPKVNCNGKDRVGNKDFNMPGRGVQPS